MIFTCKEKVSLTNVSYINQNILEDGQRGWILCPIGAKIVSTLWDRESNKRLDTKNCDVVIMFGNKRYKAYPAVDCGKFNFLMADFTKRINRGIEKTCLKNIIDVFATML